MDHIKEQSAYS